MIKIGITGQAGFIGTHLYNFLGLKKNVERIPFKDEYFENEEQLQKFVNSCDTIVHLAALNRHNDPQLIYNTNIDLVMKLILACEKSNSAPHILFSSSTQEGCDNLYGKSKKDGRLLFENWSKKNNAHFTGLVIPNVFGPFGQPYYNSFIATFCHQLAHNESSKIKIDREVNLIYIGQLVDTIYNKIKEHTLMLNINKKNKCETYYIPYTSTNKVSSILNLLQSYKVNYFEKGIIPNLDNTFEKNLFYTFLSYIDHISFFPFYLTKHLDNRGSFVEIIKLNSGGQISFSTTKPRVTRGNHFHIRKVERFAVIKGKALIQLRRIGTDKVLNFKMNGEEPSYVDMPIWYTHNIKNIGDDELLTIFWTNKHFNPEDPDTYYEKV